MDYIYESIQIDKQLPIHLFLHQARYVADHWHDSVELLFVLRGSVDVYMQRQKSTLREEDVLVINSNEIHAIQSDEDNLLLALQIPVSFMKANFADLGHLTFHCKSFLYGPEEQEKFNEIRSLLAEMMWIYNKENYGYELKIKSLLFQLLYLLLWKFRESEGQAGSRISSKYLKRMLSIVNYINDNYMKSLNLNDIADKEHLSVPYLSSFFQKSMGMSFSQYVNQLRLKQAMRDITYSDHSITQIAMDHGFPSLKSFHKVFKDAYEVSPNQYRKGLETIHENAKVPEKNYVMYLDFDRDNAYEALFKYLPSENNRTLDNWSDKGTVTQEIHLQVSGKHKPLKPYWQEMCTISKAKEILHSEVQRQLRMVQEHIPFRYIRFHGIFDDEMMVYREGPDGQPILNFFYVDQLLDFIRSVGLRPYIELGFMPKDLASSEFSFFHKKSYLGMPKDLRNWQLLIEQFMLHCKQRYGVEEMKTWYFACWNEPDMPLFWEGSFEQYGELYTITYEAVKASCADFQMGGPDIISETIHAGEWLDTYLQFCEARKCVPDFIAFHSYPVYFTDQLDWQRLTPKSIHHSTCEDYVKETVHLLKDKLKRAWGYVPDIHVTEWNATPFHRDLTNDTTYKAAYIVKNVLENIDEVKSLAYWSLTDLLEELAPAETTFHGGLGLITNNGIKKPGYYAYEMLGRMGDQLVARGKGYCLTKSQDRYQLMVYHYCHYDRLYSMHESLGIDARNRYHVFRDMNELEMNFKVDGLPSGDYEVRQVLLSRSHGSAYDTWLEMGAPATLYPDDVAYMNSKSVPLQERKIMKIEQSTDFKCVLTPHEVRLYEIKPLYS
ncbi:helix-turn-helix domain-containing protein [Paenibacillus sp. N1-5-1-14]|uniref:GH39 family glycosyl hydrolase n=1 Tax=Paenibacillus radicibacter TaxID=2972488 RepID=UPI002159358A|nr:helix-turn-helix domain-containing protein [Paenibacillus radicibacter]MCR8642837.1 helix-turn-helix domain-containing protein [Paenibacillus radicibacter]